MYKTYSNNGSFFGFIQIMLIMLILTFTLPIHLCLQLAAVQFQLMQRYHLHFIIVCKPIVSSHIHSSLNMWKHTCWFACFSKHHFSKDSDIWLRLLGQLTLPSSTERALPINTHLTVPVSSHSLSNLFLKTAFRSLSCLNKLGGLLEVK